MFTAAKKKLKEEFLKNSGVEDETTLSKVCCTSATACDDQILTERPYYRPCFLGEMFERTQLTLIDPFMRNFKMATFLEKALTIDHGFLEF